MFVKKNFIMIAAAALISGSLAVYADSNDLLKMDIKRSSMNDAVDVTFYTTGGSTSSVVTRKSDNRYVVLLPNVAGSPSVAPNIGGVKDLISDVDVKSVDDGIGGYTKVTFTTTKPVKIQTTTKKTAPLTQAQHDYKNLIAANSNTKPAVSSTPKTTAQTTKPAVQTQNTKPAVNTTAKPAAKPASQNQAIKPPTSQNFKLVETKQNTAANNIKNVISIAAQSVKPQNTDKTASKAAAAPAAVKTATPQNVSAPTKNANVRPRMKFDENGKRVVDLEPRVNHNIGVKKPANKAKVQEPILEDENTNITNTESVVEQTEQTVPQAAAVETPIQPAKGLKQQENKLPILPIAGLGSILALFLLGGISKIFGKKSDDFRMPVKNYAAGSSQKEEYQDIIEDESLNWQEKYKKYSKKDEEKNKQSKIPGYSYVTNAGATKRSIVSIDDVNSVNNQPKTKEQVLDTVRSQLEHSFNNTITEPMIVESNTSVKSEEEAISKNISNAKLKTFAKTQKLNETNRKLLSEKKKKVTSPLQESRFVKLRNSALSVSRRNSANSDLNISDLLRTGNKYLDNRRNGVMKMTEKKEENYVLSSLDEYLSILDSESPVIEKTVTSTSATVSKPSNVMSRSGITNPMEKTNPMLKSKTSTADKINGFTVKSGYNIDNEKGFYLVNSDGISALIGKIKDEVFVLKKFDRLIDSTLQVRLDYGSVYIVRAGGYKCLVDVAEDKMGTLLEI